MYQCCTVKSALMCITHTTQTHTALRPTNKEDPLPPVASTATATAAAAETIHTRSSERRKDVDPILEGSNRCWHATSSKAGRAGRGGRAGCWGERFAEMASDSDKDAQEPSNPREWYFVDSHYCCVLLLLRNLLLWQPRHKPSVGRVADFAT